MEVEDLAPVKDGPEVICQARVILVEDRFVAFQVKGHESVKEVGREIYRGRIIDVDRFARSVQGKPPPVL